MRHYRRPWHAASSICEDSATRRSDNTYRIQRADLSGSEKLALARFGEESRPHLQDLKHLVLIPKLAEAA
jgi:hypothetical protein